MIERLLQAGLWVAVTAVYVLLLILFALAVQTGSWLLLAAALALLWVILRCHPYLYHS